MLGPVKARRTVLVVAGSLVVASIGLVVWADASSLSPSECRRLEENEFPRVEALAHETLDDVGDRFSRYSSCEETGEPGAVVTVSVYNWTSNAGAAQNLREAGLDVRPGEGVAYTSDGAFNIDYYTARSRQENVGQKFVVVAFRLVN